MSGGGVQGETRGRRSGLLRNLRESKPVTYVELYFDLVFVFAPCALLMAVVIWDLTYSGVKPGDQGLPQRV